ncbi:5-methyltetrahydropteroyltriglutamate--homocysteine S-methyltransferase [Marinobacter salicampi]|uniref:5-methyltetrahydropteroyltriglutamate-- homocysteine S-methyltransferase n=1 Tax=Marinobacter salicampi TaxID=435907 RepID=UPI00140A71A8|nr:5-methyltetrahydropteroyltriglutamate--homocysteine S-methyltransferase [Marinobacter salicampi]
MAKLHLLGLPRIGPDRELKWALEKHWRGDLDQTGLQAVAAQLRQSAWQQQAERDLDLITVGDFSLYDQVLDHSLMFNLIPKRFRGTPGLTGLDRYFALARGWQGGEHKLGPSPMLKWFDTNYHYLAPELDQGTQPELDATALLAQVSQAQALGKPLKVTLIGPITLLWLSQADTEEGFQRLDLLEPLLQCYLSLSQQLNNVGITWLQLDEPALCVDLPADWRAACERAYNRLAASQLDILLATYFEGLRENLSLAFQLPVAAVHIDVVRAPDQLVGALDRLGPNKQLSLGVIDGRNIWRTDLESALERLRPVQERLGDRLWLSTSCSLLHAPYSAAREAHLPEALHRGLAFAEEKQAELELLKAALNEPDSTRVTQQLDDASSALAALASLPGRSNDRVRQRQDQVTEADRRRGQNAAARKKIQQQTLNLPLLPTTTIGSFPQDQAIRETRKAFRQGSLDEAGYQARMAAAIEKTVRLQEDLGLDVLVHGEPERNDMVEYFGDRLEGFATTRFGWVQSYGSRCVKPPVIFGDCQRRTGLTLDWMAIARKATAKPLKGMLTGPVTIIAWSFVRDDLPLARVADQLALCLRDEVRDLEALGIDIVQVDEPALRELLPLRKTDRPAYLAWAVDAFRLATSGASSGTQIHTHMCYSQFGDIMANIRALDADVITIEAARGELVLVRDLHEAGYSADVGPGVYDIHSPLVPSAEEMQKRLGQILLHLPAGQVWVNPDCGLKTRNWDQVETALTAMVEAARQQRKLLARELVAAP